jgi:PKD repeat protein
MKNVTLILLVFLGNYYFSQKEVMRWYFGGNCDIDFTGAAPITHSNSAMVAGEGCGSIADENGNLLFYTNGVEIWNKNHVTMANGASLLGSGSTSQSSLISKKPGSSNLYYVFTLGSVTSVTNPVFAYSIVDMSLAAGLGSVTVKNAILGTGYNEALHATLHCNGQDVWVAVHKRNSNDYNVFLLSSSGVNNNPIVSFSGTNTSQIGTMKFSPSGRRLCLANGDSVEVLDFDPSTGQFSSPLFLAVTGGLSYGCEFSPDGSKVYVTSHSTPGKLYQWDLCAGTASAVAASVYTVSSPVSLHGLQLDPRGQILVAKNNSPDLAAITNPNAVGSACNFLQNALPVNSGTVYSGLPNFLSHYFRQKPLVSYNTNCGSVVFNYTAPAFCAQTSYSINNVQWFFGDTASGALNTSTLTIPTHSYSSNGTYTVKFIASYNCYSDTMLQTVSIIGLPALTVTGKTSICVNEFAKLTLAGAVTYSLNSNQVTNTFSVNPVTTTVYTITGSNSNSCKSVKIVTITVNPCTALSEEENADIFRIYPNPGQGKFFINGPTILHIYNELGEELKTISVGSGEQVLDLTGLQDGIYFVRNASLNFQIKLVVRR